MKATILLTKEAYQKLIKKAQLVERFRVLLKEEYPLGDYSDDQIEEFERLDRVSPQTREAILSLIKRYG